MARQKGSCLLDSFLIVTYGFPTTSLCMRSQSCLFVIPVDCSPPGSSVHEILQARILEWVAVSSSRGSSQPRDRTQVS